MTLECTLEEQPRQPTLTVRFRSKVADLPQHFERAFSALVAYLDELGEAPCSPPYARYLDISADELKVEAGFAVPHRLPSRGEIAVSELPAASTATCIHVGPYTAIASSYDKLMAFIHEHGLDRSGDPMYEFYLSGPDVPEAETRTKVVVPVRPIARG